MLQHRGFLRNIAIFYRKNKLPLLAVATFAISTLVLLKFLHIREISQPPPFYGDINDIVIPPRYNSNQSASFKYPEILTKAECINRQDYNKEFLRFVHIPPEHPKHQVLKYTLVAGSKSPVGAALVRYLKRNHIPVVEVEGPYDLGFASTVDTGAYNNLTLSNVFIVAQPPFPALNHTASNVYYQGSYVTFFQRVLQLSSIKRVPAVIVMQPPFLLQHIETIQWYSANLILLPYLADMSQIDDLDNPFVKIYQDCVYTKKSTVRVNDYPVIVASPDDVIPEILRVAKRPGGTELVTIKGHKDLKLKDAISLFTDLLPGECKVTTTKSVMELYPSVLETVRTTIGSSKADFLKMMKAQLAKIPEGSTMYSTVKPYVSIVLAGSADQYNGTYIHRLQTYIDSTANSISYSAPQASIEIVVVEIPKKGEKCKFNDNIKVPEVLRKHVRIIEGPEDVYDGVTFPEFLAKNIGIRRAFGDFVLISDVNAIIPIVFYDIVARRHLNKGIVYRANTLEENGTVSYDEYAKTAEKSFVYAHNNEGYYEKCTHFSGFVILRGKSEYDIEAGCDSMSFTMASKELWYAISGLNEYPYNDNLDMISFMKFFKIVPGIPIHFFPFPLFKYPVPELVNKPFIDINPDEIQKQYQCSGDTTAAKKFGDSARWGLPNTKLKIFVK